MAPSPVARRDGHARPAGGPSGRRVLHHHLPARRRAALAEQYLGREPRPVRPLEGPGPRAARDQHHRICFRNRSVWTALDGNDLSDSIGLPWGINNSGSSSYTRLNQLWWQQSLLDDSLRLQFGRLDEKALFDQNRVAASDAKQFFMQSLVHSQTVAFPSNGMGFNLRWEPGKAFYATAGFGDANGNPDNRAADGVASFGRGQYFEAAEVGWSPDIPGLERGTYRFMGWHTAATNQHREGSGVASSSSSIPPCSPAGALSRCSGSARESLCRPLRGLSRTPDRLARRHPEHRVDRTGTEGRIAQGFPLGGLEAREDIGRLALDRIQIDGDVEGRQAIRDGLVNDLEARPRPGEGWRRIARRRTGSVPRGVGIPRRRDDDSARAPPAAPPRLAPGARGRTACGVRRRSRGSRRDRRGGAPARPRRADARDRRGGAGSRSTR